MIAALMKTGYDNLAEEIKQKLGLYFLLVIHAIMIT